MGFFEKLFSIFKKKERIEFTEEELVSASACPNCWGHQEYQDKYFEYVEDQTKSNINHDKFHKKSFVQQFVETNITGIRLKKEGDLMVCPSCKSSHKVVPAKAN